MHLWRALKGGATSSREGRELVSNAAFERLVAHALHLCANALMPPCENDNHPEHDSDNVQTDHVPYAPQVVLTGMSLHASLLCFSTHKQPL